MNLPKVFILFSLITFHSCKQNEKNNFNRPTSNFTEEQQDSIENVYLRDGAWRQDMYSQEWQNEIDKGLAVDATIAYLWQQKAMPLFKQGKYEVGMPFINEAVKIDPKNWQDYRAFLKCIFSKQYVAAISDFKDYKEKYGDGFIMDHSYSFYIALSCLQLNEFEKAEKVFAQDYAKTIRNHGRDWLHHLDLFYYGISKYELGKYTEALQKFDEALAIYPQFSDVQYYKASILYRLERTEEADLLYKKAKENAKKGYTINEDNAIYERYPYQVRWY